MTAVERHEHRITERLGVDVGRLRIGCRCGWSTEADPRRAMWRWRDHVAAMLEPIEW